MEIDRYKAGTCIHITNEVKNIKDELTDPDGGVAIYIYNGSGELIIDGAAMSKSEVGKYFYDWQTSEDNKVGMYTLQVRAISGVKVSIEEDSDTLELY